MAAYVRWRFIRVGLGLALGLACAVSTVPLAAAEAAARPNVVLILTDDQGWGDVRRHGNTQLDTPTLDRLAAEGTSLEQYFVSPLCAPTRASLLTGRYHLRTGVSWVSHDKEGMRASEVTIAEVLRQAGYATGCFGKWHNGGYYPRHPNGQGFDEFFGFCGGHLNNYFDSHLEHNGQPVQAKGYITTAITDRALEFIAAQQKQPFFCYLAYNAPHSPFQIEDALFDKHKQRGCDDKLASVYGMVEQLDGQIARVLTKLDELKLAQNTLVVFMTDNGPNSDRYNGVFRGRKGSIYEGGSRVPCFIRWPGTIAAGAKRTQLSAHLDWFPTLLDYCGVALPKDVEIDGRSLRPILEQADANWPARTLFTATCSRQLSPYPGAVRTDRYRLIAKGKTNELYDIVADPGEKRDIAAEHVQTVRDLRASYDRWFAAVTVPPPSPEPIPIGHAARPQVELEAPSAKLTGGVAFHGKNGYANDWISGWTAAEDRIAWSLDVVTAGKYEVSVLYTCPAENLGGRVTATAGAAAASAKVSIAHDPAPLPSPDRVDRGEVYEKEWRQLVLGVLELAAGPATLSLSGEPVAGKPILQVKGVRMRKVE